MSNFLLTKSHIYRINIGMNNIDFYKRCSDIVGIETEITVHTPRMKKFDKNGKEIFRPRHITRWNNRKPGNGRFPGLGIIRAFSAGQIHINIKNPTLTGVYTSYESALSALVEVFDVTDK